LCGGAIDPTDLVSLDEEYVAGDAGHGKAADKIGLPVYVDMPHQPAGGGHLVDQGGHLPAGSAPGGREVKEHNLAGGRGSRRMGRRCGGTQPRLDDKPGEYQPGCESGNCGHPSLRMSSLTNLWGPRPEPAAAEGEG